jgi:hypothetical protein
MFGRIIQALLKNALLFLRRLIALFDLIVGNAHKHTIKKDELRGILDSFIKSSIPVEWLDIRLNIFLTWHVGIDDISIDLDFKSVRNLARFHKKPSEDAVATPGLDCVDKDLVDRLANQLKAHYQ